MPCGVDERLGVTHQRVVASLSEPTWGIRVRVPFAAWLVEMEEVKVTELSKK